MLETWHKEPCKCCGGTGIQARNDGIIITCPCCGGSGQRNISNMKNLPPGIYCCNN
jgi:hypothetical protein